MNSLKWPAVTTLGILAGYFIFTTTTISPSIVVEKPAIIQPDSEQHLSRTFSSPRVTQQNTTSPANVKTQAEQAIVKRNNIPIEESTLPPSSVAAPITEPAITPDEIDRVLPFPFNTILKKGQENDLATYKRFADAHEQDDWDRTMQSHLTDVIYSSPYLNKLKLESIYCKGNVCEIRVFDQSNQNVWQNIMNTITAQPWWENPVLSTYLFSIKEKEGDIATPGYFVLFPKKN